MCERERPEGGVRFPGPGVTEGCEALTWVLGMALGSPAGAVVILTTKGSLQPCVFVFEAGSLYTALVIVEVEIQTRLGSNPCLLLPPECSD